MTTLYNYDPLTGEFLHKSEARLDPIDKMPMVPAHATLDPVPQTAENEIAVWADDKWSVQKDHRGTSYWLPDGSKHTVTKIGETLPPEALDAAPPAAREVQREFALIKVDQEHARYLVQLTGGATVAERDTWKVKEEAARAFVAETATVGQSAMLTTEAKGAGVTEAQLAAKIIGKADAFLALIGVSAAIRAKGRAAIAIATADAVPLDQVEAKIQAVFDQLSAEVQTEIAKLSGQS